MELIPLIYEKNCVCET